MDGNHPGGFLSHAFTMHKEQMCRIEINAPEGSIVQIGVTASDKDLYKSFEEECTETHVVRVKGVMKEVKKVIPSL